MKNNLNSFSKILSLCFLSGILISFNLWTDQRNFPVFPVFYSFEFPALISQILRVILITLLLTNIFVQSKKILLLVILVLFTLIFLDQTRLQPWVYFYLLILVPFSITNNKEEIFNYLRYLLIGIYLWSGIQKFNPNFQTIIFESILVDGFRITTPLKLELLKKFYIIIPIIEVCIGLSLIFKKTRYLGVVMATISHLFILYYLIFGIQGNWVIIPCNLFLIYCVVFVFYYKKPIFPFTIKSKLLASMLLIVFLLPLGNFNNSLDKRLTFSLYDGNLKSLYQINSDINHQGKILEKLLYKGVLIDYNFWSYKELSVPFYPEERFLKQLIKQTNGKLILTDIPLWERNVHGTFKTIEEIKKYNALDTLFDLSFKTKVYFPNFNVLK